MVTTNYLWNDITDTVAMEKDGAGNTTAVYQSDPVPFGRLRSMRRGGTTYNYHYDGRGNTTYLTDQSGRKTDVYTYDAFGTQRTATGSTENPYRFGGQHGYQYNPATDDYYVRARVYQPKRGRWLSKDPLRFVDGLNPYEFVGNSPTKLIDPSGSKRIIAVFEGNTAFKGKFKKARFLKNAIFKDLSKDKFRNLVLYYFVADNAFIRNKSASDIQKLMLGGRQVLNCKCIEPTIILVGHSHGGDKALTTASFLERGLKGGFLAGKAVPSYDVNLLFTFDPVNYIKPLTKKGNDKGKMLPKNVKKAINIYQRVTSFFYGYRIKGATNIEYKRGGKPSARPGAFRAHVDMVSETIYKNMLLKAVKAIPTSRPATKLTDKQRKDWTPDC